MSASALPHISEHDEQANFITSVYLQYGNRTDFAGKLLFAVPNGSWFGGSNPWAMFKKFEKEGFQKGVADLIYLQPRGEYSCWANEMKAEHRRKEKDPVSDDQKEFLQAVKANHGAAFVSFGCDEAFAAFNWYMALPVKE